MFEFDEKGCEFEIRMSKIVKSSLFEKVNDQSQNQRSTVNELG